MTWSQPEPRSEIETVEQRAGLHGRGHGERMGTERHTWLGAIIGGCSETVDALPERGYTVHVVSLPELRGLLHPEGHHQ
jgi:hypothetical protein